MGVVDAVEWACVAGLHSKLVSSRICIKFCVKLEHSSVETGEMIQKAYGMMQ